MKKPIPQHLLLSAEARNLSPIAIARMNEYEAMMTMKKLRWGADGVMICPRCGEKQQAYFIKTRHQWQCKCYNYCFSVTAGTLFAHHKLPLRDILFSCSLYVNATKGLSALQVARDLNAQYKTTFVLLHKIKEALKVYKQQEAMQLSGIVHMMPLISILVKNPRIKRVSVLIRLKQHGNPLKRAILVMRDSFAKQDAKQNTKQIDARNAIAFVARSENSKVVNNLANKHSYR